MKMTKKQWDQLRYPIEIRMLSQEEGGGWIAHIPLLGKGMFMMEGDTPEEAIGALEEHRKAMYSEVIASGVEIPLPHDEEDPEP